jgi:hypothetical protein
MQNSNKSIMDTTQEQCTYYAPCGGFTCEACTLSIRQVREKMGVNAGEGDVRSTSHLDPSRRSGIDTYLDKDWWILATGCSITSVRSSSQPRQPVRRVLEVKQKRRTATRANYGVLKRVERRDSVLSLPSGSKLDALLNSESKERPSENRSDNKFSVLEDEDLDTPVCKFKKRNAGRAVALAKFFALELELQANWSTIGEVECGGVRPAVRGCFDNNLTVLQELSIKTSQKVEKSCCDNCLPRFQKKIAQWKRGMKKDVKVDPDHLERYKKLFRANVPKGWNSRKYPYVPNGHSARQYPRSVGGNWNKEEFAEDCAYSLVFSSGKPRVVTSYSSYNSEILYPLHMSLYHYLKKRKWLLAGDPTNERVEQLNGTGPYLSFDYVGATDNIKVDYVRAGIEILIELAEDISEDEKRCLRVLGNLQLYDRVPCTVPLEVESNWDDNFEDYYSHMKNFARGQPMGSFMSFPLLCLTNKTIVDLSLTDLLESKSLTFKEWTEHRCLVNGDDLLLREPGVNSNLRDRIIFNGGQVGMETNREKCLLSDSQAEVNSTLFIDNKKQKKTNAKAMFPEKMTEDFLSMAKESTSTIRGFIKCVRANTRLLSRQKDKYLWKLPFPYQAACRKDRKIRKALMMQPIDAYDEVDNFLGVAEKPKDYDLTPDEERTIIKERVNKIRDGILLRKKWELDDKLAGQFKPREKKKIRVIKVEKSWRSLVRKRKSSEKDFGLSCCVEYFEKRKRQAFVDSEAVEFSSFYFENYLCELSLGQLSIDEYEGKGSLIQRLSDFLKSSKSTLVSTPSPVRDNLCRDFISLRTNEIIAK